MGTGRYYTGVAFSDITSGASGYTKTATATAAKPTIDEMDVKCETSTKLSKIIQVGIYHECSKKTYEMMPLYG